MSSTTTTRTTTTADEEPVGALPVAPGRPAAARIGVVVALLIGYIAVVAAAHIAQGTSAVGVGDVFGWVLGRADTTTAAVIESSRLPRVVAGVVVGLALGVAGAIMQSFSRNLLASPDTLAVNQGAFLALTLSGVVGLSVPALGQFGVAFAGGLAGALLVLLLAGSQYGTVRLILAGITLGLVMTAVSTALIIMFPQEARGLYAWSAGTLSQNGFGGIERLGPLVLVGLAGALLLARRLDLLMLGDDEASSLGVPVRRTQVQALAVSLLLSAAAVTLAGPIGYVGLVAPTLVRLLAGAIPGLHRHLVLVPVSALAGVALLLSADVAIRALIGAQGAVQVPTGVMTSAIGGLFLVVLAVRLRSSGFGGGGDALDVRGGGVGLFPLVVAGGLAVLATALLLAVLLGDRVLLPGDLVVWARGDAGPIVSGVMSTRAPRVLAAFLAGVALAAAGTVVQGVTRNPLADTGIIGITGGAALAGVVVVSLTSIGFWGLQGAAAVGALIAGLIVFGLSARSGFATDRLLLVGVGLGVCLDALVTTVVVSTDPFNQSLALTWLSGSTYGRVFAHLVPLAIGCLVVIPLLATASRRLDLLSIDEDTPVLLGLDVARARVLLVTGAVLLAGFSVAAIGPVAFVGLVAPHAARTLAGRRHGRVLLLATLIGGTVVVLGDMLGRTVIAPVQLPASLLTAVIGAPYFLWLMYRSRRIEV